MGVERWYVAVVDGGRLLERAASDPAFGELLGLPCAFGPDRRAPRGALGAELMAEVDAMNRAHPEIERRVFTLDRKFDILHFLLSEERRRGIFDGADPATRAIRGAKALPDHLRGGQGHPIRYSPPADVAEVAAWLARRTADDLRAAFDPEAMEAQAVYKFRNHLMDDRDWRMLAGYLEGLRSFHAEAASHGEGVLVVAT